MHAMAPHLIDSAQRAAGGLLAELDGARSIVIATVDGFEVAHTGTQAVDPARLAAMVSSFAAVGDAASRETGIGVPRCLVIESTDGRLVVRCIEIQGESLIVVILTDKATLLGLVWNALVAAEKQMAAA